MDSSVLNPFFYLQFLFEELPQLDMEGELKINHGSDPLKLEF